MCEFKYVSGPSRVDVRVAEYFTSTGGILAPMVRDAREVPTITPGCNDPLP
ncbi:hypothetical protein Syun_006753 [Stephania yunnanensis]|uniref:Uncharacterized protein n=1 Tax=Stephania yunnanensis TaxID=152371 RepID=A0AAP0KYV6_9MAGN